MTLPFELVKLMDKTEETDVIGDIDVWIDQFERGVFEAAWVQMYLRNRKALHEGWLG